ncbi:MAG: phosphate ABC transporter permease PstA [Peptococcaceae bacterium]|nr:phosphate ABC transporter permease PstA [Peptococcaceae bacterium]
MQKHDRKRRNKEKIFHFIFFLTNAVSILFLAVLLIQIFIDGYKWLDWQFLTSFMSRFPERAGILPSILGTIWIMILTLAISTIVGIGTAVYIENFATKNFFTSIIQTNISNLAGVPSIVYGILGLAVFVRLFELGRSILAGSLTMTLLVLPIIIIASQEAIKTVPENLIHASYALGATKLQTIRKVILPYAMPGILTGTILATSRAVGEAAPLITVGALAYVSFIPFSPLDSFTVLPIQIFNWTSRPQADFQGLAAAGIIVLLAVLLSLNALAIVLRNKYQKRTEGL